MELAILFVSPFLPKLVGLAFAFVIGTILPWQVCQAETPASTDDSAKSGDQAKTKKFDPGWGIAIAQKKADKRPLPKKKQEVNLKALAKKRPPSPAEKQKRARQRTIGDLSFRFDAGLDLFRLSLASGELITESIGTRSYRLNLNFEYGYFLGNNTTLYFALPIAFDIDPIVGTFFFLDIGVGARQYFGRFLFVDLSVRATLVNFSRFLFDFGGFVLAFGVAIPIAEQVRLLVIARAPFNVIGGFRFRILSQVGVEALF